MTEITRLRLHVSRGSTLFLFGSPANSPTSAFPIKLHFPISPTRKPLKSPGDVPTKWIEGTDGLRNCFSRSVPTKHVGVWTYHSQPRALASEYALEIHVFCWELLSCSRRCLPAPRGCTYRKMVARESSVKCQQHSHSLSWEGCGLLSLRERPRAHVPRRRNLYKSQHKLKGMALPIEESIPQMKKVTRENDLSPAVIKDPCGVNSFQGWSMRCLRRSG